MSPSALLLLGFRCVALLYVQFSIEQNDEVGDTTGDAKIDIAGYINFCNTSFIQ